MHNYTIIIQYYYAPQIDSILYGIIEIVISLKYCHFIILSPPRLYCRLLTVSWWCGNFNPFTPELKKYILPTF